MRKGQFATTVAIHACPVALNGIIERKITPLMGSVTWVNQPLWPDHVSTEFSLQITEDQLEELASELYAIGSIYFEANQRQGKYGLLFMGVPGLGVFRGELNQSGSILLSEDRLTHMISIAAGNQREFMRLLRVGLGQSWDDIIEPFRAARFTDKVVLLNRAG